MTCEHSPQQFSLPMELAPLTSSRLASRAKTLALLDVVPGWKGSAADYGLRSSVWFASYSPDLSCWKTAQVSALGEVQRSSLRLPMSGMMQSGKVFRRCPLAPSTYELDSSLWPTPVKSDTGHRRVKYSQGGTALSMAIGGPLNPEWGEWLMGFPMGWTDVRP